MYSEIPPEIEDRFLEGLSFADVVQYSHVCRQSQYTVRSLLALRCTTLLLQYFDSGNIPGFWEAVTAGCGGLTGSGPLWLTDAAPTWMPNDLNVVVATGGSYPTRTFLRTGGWRQTPLSARIPMVMSSRSMAYPMEAYSLSSRLGDRCWRFTKTGHPAITLSKTADPTVFRHIAGAKHTMATMLLTRSSIIALHPEDVVRKIVTWRYGSGSPSAERDYARSRAKVMGGRDRGSPDWVRVACGRRCPALLRRLRGGEGLGLMRWKADLDNVAEDAYRGFLDDKYAIGWTWAACRINHCEMYGFPRTILSPAEVGRTFASNPKEDRILNTIHALTHTVPVRVLFATLCGEPMLVPVPLDHGRSVFRTIDDLRADTWISCKVGFPRCPLFAPAGESIGGATFFTCLAWKECFDDGEALLIFMTSIHPIRLGNSAIAAGEAQGRTVHGDVLLLLETHGDVQDARLCDIQRMKDKFAQLDLEYEKRGRHCRDIVLDEILTQRSYALRRGKYDIVPSITSTPIVPLWLAYATIFERLRKLTLEHVIANGSLGYRCSTQGARVRLSKIALQAVVTENVHAIRVPVTALSALELCSLLDVLDLAMLEALAESANLNEESDRSSRLSTSMGVEAAQFSTSMGIDWLPAPGTNMRTVAPKDAASDAGAIAPFRNAMNLKSGMAEPKNNPGGPDDETNFKNEICEKDGGAVRRPEEAQWACKK
ncbi:hypothetical protein B0H15DRAFT_798653 [Mycena belliarum]|uniref:F-box domain-containing protein n=1 Tax=Mycena belliarum TaxID=1033014 RepID=A0AAD6U9Y7_9AGAR|nr:hypothetical protein B0H15DRAFT_798653 [Mycena belliae]